MEFCFTTIFWDKCSFPPHDFGLLCKMAANGVSVFLQSYMEDHLKNKNRLEREWEALCSYQAEPCACSIGHGEQNSKRNRSDAIVVCESIQTNVLPCLFLRKLCQKQLEVRNKSNWISKPKVHCKNIGRTKKSQIRVPFD